MKSLVKRLLFLSLLSAPLTFAAPVEWTINNLSFSKAGFQTFGINGTFSYDADTGTYSNLAASEGADLFTLNYVSDTSDSVTWSNVSTGPLTFTFATPLTDAGGIVDITADLNGTDSNPGAYVSAAVAAPEPSTVLLLTLGLPSLALLARRKQIGAAPFPARKFSA